MEKRLNIFITADEKKILDNLKYKYRISYSTIAEILAVHYQFTKTLQDALNGERLIKNGKKTSIKADTEHNWAFSVYENAIHIYCNKLDRELLKSNKPGYENHVYSKERNALHNEFAKRKDPYYDYNTFIRYAEAFKKQRKEQI